jgi:hypothetical protein
MCMWILIFVCILIPHGASGQNLPEYELNYGRMMNQSRGQQGTIVIASVQLSKSVNTNPSIADWTFDNDGEEIIVLWCPRKAWKPPCQYSVISMAQLIEALAASSSESAPHRTHKPLVTWKKSVDYDRWRYGHVIEDARMYASHPYTYSDPDGMSKMRPSPLSIVYSVRDRGTTKLFSTHITELIYNSSTKSLSIDYPPNIVKPDFSDITASSSTPGRHEKNWSPFVYENRSLLVYSIAPFHHIVGVNKTMIKSDVADHMGNYYNVSMKAYSLHKTSSAVLASDCSSSSSGDKFAGAWSWGEPRGGSNTVLIETVHGLRYLSIFHSSGKVNHRVIHSWFMGAYLFSASPPFEMTHISSVPILPKALYDESTGWAYKTVDYIVYPLGLLVRGDSLYLSVGKNDAGGWIVQLNATALVASLIATPARCPIPA